MHSAILDFALTEIKLMASFLFSLDLMSFIVVKKPVSTLRTDHTLLGYCLKRLNAPKVSFFHINFCSNLETKSVFTLSTRHVNLWSKNWFSFSIKKNVWEKYPIFDHRITWKNCHYRRFFGFVHLWQKRMNVLSSWERLLQAWMHRTLIHLHVLLNAKLDIR